MLTLLHPVVSSGKTMAEGESGRPLGLEHAELSDVGLRRANNQDSLATMFAASGGEIHRRGHLFLVADGMGAHAAGELASKLAADIIPLTYYKLPDASPAVALRRAVEEANQKIHARGQENADFHGMGTTVSVLALLAQGAIVAQVGDSRVYRLRGDQFEQLSFDHSLVWEMRASGKLSDGKVPDYIPRNIITRSLGPADDVLVDLEGPFPLLPGDTFLLCTDGLSGQMDDEEIAAVLRSLTPDQAVQALVDLANLRGGPDNITAIIVRLTGTELMDAASNETSPGDAARPTPKAAVHPLSWIFLGVLSALTVVFGVTGQVVAATVTGLGALLSGAFVILQWASATQVEESIRETHFGAGPYAAVQAGATRAFVEKLANTCRQLRDAAEAEGWQVDRTEFDSHIARAERAVAGGNLLEAARASCMAISDMMRQIRGLRQTESREAPGPTPPGLGGAI